MQMELIDSNPREEAELALDNRIHRLFVSYSGDLSRFFKDLEREQSKLDEQESERRLDLRLPLNCLVKPERCEK